MANDEEVIVTWDPNAANEGVCETCGATTRSPRVKKCDDCKATKQDSTQDNKRKVDVKVPRKPGTVTANKAAGTFAKLVLLLSAAWAWQAVKRYGIPDPLGTLADELAFTDEEAADIARPLARLSMSNSTTAKAIAPIVENDDLIDAGFSLYEWRKRVDNVLSQYSGHQIADNQRAGTQNEPTGQDASGTGDGGGFDPLAAHYDGGRDARVV